MDDHVKYLKQIARFSEDNAKINPVFKSDQLAMEVLSLNPHQYLSPQVEPLSDIIYLVLSGEGVFEVGEEVLILTQNTTILVEPGISSGIINESDAQLSVLKILAPPGVNEV